MSAVSQGDKPTSDWQSSVRRVVKKYVGDASGYVFLAPMLILFILFSIWPTIRGFTLAFMNYSWIYPEYAHFNGLQNFVEMAGDPTFWHTLTRSLYFIAIFTPVTVILPLIVASMIASVKHRGLEGFYRVIIYLPVILPIAVALLLWRQAFNENFGWINLVLHNVFNIPFRSLPHWLSDPKLTMPVTVVAVTWKHFGQNVLLFLIGLYNINPELYEAAKVDGASGIQRWRYITIPLLKPVIVIVLILGAKFIGITQEPMIMWADRHTPGGGPQDMAYTLGLYSYNVAFLFGDLRWGYAAALSLAGGIIAMALAGLIFWRLRTEETE